MEQTNPNLSTDFVKDMLAESPAKESKAVVADRIPKLPKNVHWAVKAVVEPYPEDRKEVMALMSLPFLGMMGGDARFLYRNQEVHHLGFECCLVGEQSIGKSALTRMQNVLISKVIEENAQMMQVPVFARNANAWVFCQMREEFYNCNVEDAYTQMGLKATGYRTIVARWIKNGWVEKVDKDRFRKTELGLQICNQMMKVAS